MLQREAKHDRWGKGSFENQAADQAEAEGGCVARARGYRSLGHATLPHDETPWDICKDDPRTIHYIYNVKENYEWTRLIGQRAGVSKMSMMYKSR